MGAWKAAASLKLSFVIILSVEKKKKILSSSA